MNKATSLSQTTHPAPALGRATPLRPCSEQNLKDKQEITNGNIERKEEDNLADIWHNRKQKDYLMLCIYYKGNYESR